MDEKELIIQQKTICLKYGAEYCRTPVTMIAGMSLGVSTITKYPYHGLRHPLLNDTSGWYIWNEDVYSPSDNFFAPIHIYHLEKVAPLLLPYLALPPGWRFLLSDEYVDVWFDDSLLNI